MDLSSTKRRLAVCAAAFVIGASLALLLAIGNSSAIEAHLAVHPPAWSTLLLRNGRTGALISLGGILAGLPTLGLLGGNGFVVGRMISGYVVNQGGFSRFLLLTVPHGVIELPALLLCGAVGLGIALHLLSLLGVRVETPRAGTLLREGLTAVILILVAAAVESRITPELGAALWSVAALAWVDDSFRWLGIGFVECVCFLSISRLFDAVERLPELRRRAYGRALSHVSPVAAVVTTGWGLALEAPLVAAWKGRDPAHAILFGLVCGLPPLFYGVARGYGAQTGRPYRKLSIHLPWLGYAVVSMGATYAVLALTYAVMPSLSLMTRAVTTGMLALFAVLLVVPPVLRRLYAREIPCDWRAPGLRPATELLDRLSFPRSRVHLIRMRGGRRVTNAMATGIVPGSGKIFMTESLLELLDPPEVAAVLAHEVGHIRRRHLVYALVFQATLAGLVDVASVFAQRWAGNLQSGGLGVLLYVVLLIVIVAVALPLALAAGARIAERDADAFAAESGWAEFLATALEKIPGPDPESDEAPLLTRAYSLHPSRSARVGALRAFGRDGSALAGVPLRSDASTP